MATETTIEEARAELELAVSHPDWDDSTTVALAPLRTLLASEAALRAGLAEAVRLTFQQRVAPWMQECFGPVVAADKVERFDRFIEEAFELAQSCGYDRGRITALIDYVWSRPLGEPTQELGGVMTTLAALALAHGLDMHAAADTELARISQPAVIDKIRRKQAAKARDIPFSPLPQAAAFVTRQKEAGK